MAFELVYTSAPRGIKPGSSGFCTVAYTNGLAANTAVQLEALSAYKAYFPPYDDHASQNPVAYSHYRVISSGEELHILSRICFNGLDYTKRSNKLAHHLVLRQHDLAQAPAGPAALFQQPGLFYCEWAREPLLFPRQKDIAATDAGIGPAATWEAYTGDAGWAGTLVERYMQTPDRPVYIIFDPLQHHDVLKLLAEAMLLLPPADRWELTFNTYFTSLPAGIGCAWRFCVPNADALREARRSPGTLIIDLTQKMPAAPDGKWQNLARSAIAPPDPEAAALPTPAGNDPAGQLRATAPNATVAPTTLKATAARSTFSPTANRASASTSAANQVPVRKRRLVVPAVIGAVALLLLIAGGVFALKHAQSAEGIKPPATPPPAPTAHDHTSNGITPPATATNTGTATGTPPQPPPHPEAPTGADSLTQRTSSTTNAPAQPPAPTADTGASAPNDDTISTALRQPLAPEQPTTAAMDAPPPAAATTPISEAPPPPKLDFNCLDLGIERDRSYLWLLNFMGHFTSIDVMLENGEEKIVSAALIRNQMVEVKNGKITILGGDMTPMDIYSLTYSGRKVTITKIECKCSDGDGKNNAPPCCTNALMGFKTRSGKEYATYPVPGISQIPDVNMDGSPADLACTLSYCPLDNMSVPANPNIFRIELTSPLKDYLNRFLAKLQIVSPNARLAYVVHLPDGSEITTTTTTTATINDIQNSKFFEPYHKALADLTQKRKMPTKGKNLDDDKKLLEAKEQAVTQALQNVNACCAALVQTLAQGKLSLCVDSQGQRHVIMDDIRMQVKP